MRRLFILTNSVGSIPQKLHETESFSTELIKEYFTDKSFEVQIISFDKFISEFSALKNRIKGSFFIYASSQYTEYYSSIEDILLLIKTSGGILIPDFIHFRAHENKYFQELIKTDLNIDAPKSILVSTIEEGMNKIKDIRYPVVAKLSFGYGSTSVSLLKNINEASEFLNKNLAGIVKKRKNIFKYRKKIEEYRDKYPLKVGKVIFQEFIEGLEFDWKIIIFGNKLFYLKRYVRPNDFKASGSGNFDNSQPPSSELIHFAFSVKFKLNTPWVSLDIVHKQDRFYLIEYQCIHFGMYTVIKSISHFVLNGETLTESRSPVNADMLFAEELYNYINGNNID
ncbi:MAG TPA: hypothetical protein PKW56_04400 [Clostridiales bacterium]|mgnify:CR=1 FL=1|nr:hypothetical protein [Clostridiales bacterium]